MQASPVQTVCKKCVLDISAKEITFDEQGICNFCRDWEKKEEQRKLDAKNLQWVLHQIRESGKGKKYDCLLGLSGGVDSSLCLHYLVENSIRPLTYSIDNGYNNPKADENIMRMVETLKVRFFRYTIDLEKFRELQTAFFKSGTKNVEIPSDAIIRASAYELAAKYGIKYIISGGNWASEGVMPLSWGYEPRDLRFIKAVYKKFTGKKLEGLPLMGLLKYLNYRFVKRIKVINLLDYY